MVGVVGAPRTFSSSPLFLFPVVSIPLVSAHPSDPVGIRPLSCTRDRRRELWETTKNTTESAPFRLLSCMHPQKLGKEMGERREKKNPRSHESMKTAVTFIGRYVIQTTGPQREPAAVRKGCSAPQRLTLTLSLTTDPIQRYLPLARPERLARAFPESPVCRI